MTTEAPRRGAGKALGDMTRSLGLMAVVVAVFLFIGPARTLVMPGSAARPAVDDSDAIRGFGTATHTPALVPAGLPRSWRVNAATLQHTRTLEQLHIGYAVPGSRYAGLDEGVGDPASLVRTVLSPAGATVHGSTTIAGRLWQVRRSARGEEALTRQDGNRTVVITGDATDVQLRLLAGSLR
ncbi:MAG: DUF4245 domain-containing protein [Frankiales bacterium]|nr:DUF4245 domain-containing protein [Frankiales bacterium]